MEKIRILIADDIHEISEIIKAIIEKNEKIEIVGIAKDGQEEYEKILELQPDLIFTDNEMPKLRGIDVIEKIRNEHPDLELDFIMITSERNSELYSKLCKLNIFSIVNKPFQEDKIIQIIEEYIMQKEKIIEKSNIQEKLPIVVSEKKLWKKILTFLRLIK